MRRALAILLLLVEAPLAAAQPAEDQTAAPTPEPAATFPDPRLDLVLTRASRLASSGADLDALFLIEGLARRRRCPPLLWDSEIATAVLQGVNHLQLPDAPRFPPVAIPFFVIGGLGLVGSLVATLIVALSNSFGGGGLGDEATALWVSGGISLGVVLTGVVVMVVGLVGGSTPELESRARLATRLRGEAQSHPPGEPFPAFGHRPCRRATNAAP